MTTEITTQADLDTLINGDVLVLVDFWASWCGPCKTLGPVMDELDVESDGKYKVVKVNVDEAKELALNYSIMSIPTVSLFKSGKQVDDFVGVLSKEDIHKLIDKHC